MPFDLSRFALPFLFCAAEKTAAAFTKATNLHFARKFCSIPRLLDFRALLNQRFPEFEKKLCEREGFLPIFFIYESGGYFMDATNGKKHTLENIRYMLANWVRWDKKGTVIAFLRMRVAIILPITTAWLNGTVVDLVISQASAAQFIHVLSFCTLKQANKYCMINSDNTIS